jgi:hypothetical protein
MVLLNSDTIDEAVAFTPEELQKTVEIRFKFTDTVRLTLSPTYLQFNIGHIIEDYRLEEWVTGEVSSVGSSPRPLD